MNIKDLDYEYPEHLTATEPVENSRVLLNENATNSEVSMEDLLSHFSQGDVLVLNDTKVVKKRIFAQIYPIKEDREPIEVLFLEKVGEKQWEVLFPSSRLKKSQSLLLPNQIKANLIQRGRPQRIELSEDIDFDYFANYGELPLPPYIQKARGDRHNVSNDDSWYQTAWAKNEGSAAAPTASLHFKDRHIAALKDRGVNVVYLTLHVGLGTFLPIQEEDITKHPIHSEYVEVLKSEWEKIQKAKNNGCKIWALGTTVTRSLESVAQNKLDENEKCYFGKTNLYIYPGYEFMIVDNLLTNFHQPRTSLLALVSAFSNLENVKSAYKYAVENSFRLFSYGDLSVWKK